MKDITKILKRMITLITRILDHNPQQLLHRKAIHRKAIRNLSREKVVMARLEDIRSIKEPIAGQHNLTRSLKLVL